MQKQGNALTVDKATLMLREKYCRSHWNCFGPSIAPIMNTVAYVEGLLEKKNIPRNRIPIICNSRYALSFSETFVYQVLPEKLIHISF